MPKKNPQLDAFRKMTELLDQDSHYEILTPEHLISALAGSLKDAEKPFAKAFITKLLDPRHSDNDLQDDWALYSAGDVYFRDSGELRSILRRLHDAL